MAYTKAELTPYNNGVYDLAAAVVQQWIKDGKPASEARSVEPWLGVVLQHKAFQHTDLASATTFVLPEIK